MQKVRNAYVQLPPESTLLPLPEDILINILGMIAPSMVSLRRQYPSGGMRDVAGGMHARGEPRWQSRC